MQLVNSLDSQSAGGFDIAENFTVRDFFKVSVPVSRGHQSINSRRCSQTLDFANKQHRQFVFSLFARSGVHQECGQLCTGRTTRKMEIHEIPAFFVTAG